MQKCRSIVFGVLCVILFCAPALLFGAQKIAHFELPSWLTTEDAKYLSGGVSDVNVRANATLDGFSQGKFQSSLQSEIGNYIPCKASAMLGNAAAQRGAIAASNTLFGWECYPTYYGSGYIEWPEGEMVMPKAMKISKQNTEVAAKWVETVNNLAEKYPNVNFVYQQINDVYSSDSNPSHNLVSNVYDAAWIEENITDRLNSNISIVWETIDSEEDLKSDWFSTEHHWKASRAIEAYDDLAILMGWNLCSSNTPNLIKDSWHGSSARSGLDMTYSSSLFDIDRVSDFLNLTYTVNGKERNRGLWDAALKNENVNLNSLSMQYNAYHTYFGPVVAEGVYENTNENNGKTCLVVEQSYGVPAEPLIALNYEKTIVLDILNSKVTKSLDEYLENGEIDDVVFQFGATDLYKMLTNSPVILEGVK